MQNSLMILKRTLKFAFLINSQCTSPEEDIVGLLLKISPNKSFTFDVIIF